MNGIDTTSSSGTSAHERQSIFVSTSDIPAGASIRISSQTAAAPQTRLISVQTSSALPYESVESGAKTQA